LNPNRSLLKIERETGKHILKHKNYTKLSKNKYTYNNDIHIFKTGNIHHLISF
jgi:hypothetical protein